MLLTQITCLKVGLVVTGTLSRRKSINRTLWEGLDLFLDNLGGTAEQKPFVP